LDFRIFRSWDADDTDSSKRGVWQQIFFGTQIEKI